MLEIITAPGQINFYELMRVYEQSNRQMGQQLQPWADSFEQWMEGEQWFYRYIRNEFFLVEGAFIAVWSVNFEYVSVLRAEPYIDGYLINGLETRPNKRNMGYGKMLLMSVLHHLKNLGKFPVYSHVMASNKISAAMHESVGFKAITDRGAIHLDGSVYRDSITYVKV